MKYSMEAEQRSDLIILTKANSFRKSVASKNSELIELDKLLAKMEEEKKRINYLLFN